jgi:hypothetical protein
MRFARNQSSLCLACSSDDLTFNKDYADTTDGYYRLLVPQTVAPMLVDWNVEFSQEVVVVVEFCFSGAELRFSAQSQGFPRDRHLTTIFRK